jgi:uncharacterized membrane protein
MRYVLMALFGGMAALCLVAQFAFANPLLGGLFSRELVRGLYLFDTLMVAYVPVAMMFAFAAWKLAERLIVRQAGYGLAGLYGATYLIYETRRLFRGDDLSVGGVTDGELYAYTVSMLVTSIVLLLLAYKQRSVSLRKLAMAGVGLTIAKVFLVDMSGLSGLTRVFSFMGLGLALLGLTWLNRKLSDGWHDGAPVVSAPVEPEPEPEVVVNTDPKTKPKRKAKPVRPKVD